MNVLWLIPATAALTVLWIEARRALQPDSAVRALLQTLTEKE